MQPVAFISIMSVAVQIPLMPEGVEHLGSMDANTVYIIFLLGASKG